MEIYEGRRVLENLAEFSPDMICTIDRDGYFVYVNKACQTITGYESEELTGCAYINFVHPNDREITRQAAENAINGTKIKYFENTYLHKSGWEVPMQWSAVWSEDEEVLFCIGRDITEQNQVKQHLKERDALYRAMIAHGADMIALINEKGDYLYVGGSVCQYLGYEPGQLIGQNAFRFIHPADLPKAQALWQELNTKQSIRFSDYRFKTADNKWKWLATEVSNQLQNPAIKAFIATSHDVTERKTSNFKLAESEQRFRSLFYYHPDMIFIENREGFVLDANPAATAFIGQQKNDIIHHRLADFLPGKTKLICEQYFQEALLGNPVSLELECDLPDLGPKILSISKIPIVAASEIVGVHTLVKDVTAVTHSRKTIEQQAKKLSTIFESITDAFFTMDKNWTVTYTNREFNRILLTENQNFIGQNIWQLFPEEINKKFYQQYYIAIKTGKAVHFEAYVERYNRWLEVKAFPSDEGLSVYFDDVTEKIEAKQELEKLSLVARETTNGVIITDADRRILWVNEGFTRLTGYSPAEAIGQRPSELLHDSKTDIKTFELVREKMLAGHPVAFEILNRKKTGEEIWLSVQVNPIYDEANKLIRYITTQTDITALKNSELELTSISKDLFKQNKDLQQFNYIVSHNLRAPVANILGYADLLTKLDRTSPVYDLSLANLKTSIAGLDVILKDLNTILSIRDNQDTINKSKFNLKLLCHEAIASLQESFQSCHGEVFLNIPENVYVSGNKAYLHSIFYNLLSNAIKYRSPERSLQVNIRCFGNSDSSTLVLFSDNGLGFDSEKAGNNLFKLYKRFHSHVEGRGLGLFLVKTHIEAMHGHIEVISQVDKGTRFLLYLK